MKLVQWLARGFHDGRLVEPGDQVLVADSVVLGDHMLDVATGLRGNQIPPAPTPPALPAALPKIMDLMADIGAAYPRAIAPDGRVLTFNAEHGGYEYEAAPSNVVPFQSATQVEPVADPLPAAIEAPANDAEPAADTAPSEVEPVAEPPPEGTA